METYAFNLKSEEDHKTAIITIKLGAATVIFLFARIDCKYKREDSFDFEMFTNAKNKNNANTQTHDELRFTSTVIFWGIQIIFFEIVYGTPGSRNWLRDKIVYFWNVLCRRLIDFFLKNYIINKDY